MAEVYALSPGHTRFAIPLLLLVLATSSIAIIEPAPYDVLTILLLSGFFATGLRVPREIQIASLFLGMFLLGNMIAAVLSPDPVMTLRSLSIRIYMVLAWVFFASIILLDPPRIVPAIWRGYMLAALVAVAAGSLEYFGFLSGDRWQGGLRAKGLFKDPNVYAPFLVPVAIYTVKELYYSTLRRAVIFLPFFLVAIYGLLLGFSRGAWINFFVSFSTFVLFSLITAGAVRPRLKWLLFSTTIVLAAALMIAGALLSSTVADRFYKRATLVQSYDVKEDGGRFYGQSRALDIIASDATGIGPGYAENEIGVSPHNAYLQVPLEGGWLAGLGFYGFIGLSVWRGSALLRWQSSQRPDSLVVYACILGIMSQSFFIDSGHWRHLWLLLALLWSFIVAQERSRVAHSLRITSKYYGDKDDR